MARRGGGRPIASQLYGWRPLRTSSIRRSSSTSSAKPASRPISSPTRETGVHHRGVVAVAEPAADLRQAALGELLGQVHRHLPRPRHRPCAPCRRHVGQPDGEMFRDLASGSPRSSPAGRAPSGRRAAPPASLSSVIGRPNRLACATSRFSAPSSSRTLVVILCARNSITFAGTATPARVAFASRIEMRSSNVVACRSATMP